MTSRNKPIEFLKRYWAELLTILLISISSIHRVTVDLKPCATGDGVEYVLMTEALYNHFSPDIRAGDCESFKQAYIIKNPWDTNDLALQFDLIYDFIKQSPKKYLDEKDGFFVDTRQNVYSYHFFFYSLLNVPARLIATVFSLNPLGAFQITNALLIIFSCLFFFRTSQLDKRLIAAFCFVFYFSATYWYIGWTHPEIFTICFASMGLWLFLHKKQYPGILLIALAALQNQPLAILVATLCVTALFKKGFSVKNILFIGFSSIWILIPALFYYLHFKITNLVTYKGFLDLQAVTWQRVSGFFFDLNQGMILAIPLVLFIYFYLIVKKIARFKRDENKWDLLLFFAIICMILVACTMIHWNHGQAVVNRYVTYLGALLIVHFFFLVVEYSNKKVMYSILLSAVLSQIASTLYFEKYNNYGKSDQPKEISNWVLENYPAYYNPDPQIFFYRYIGGIVNYERHSPAYYMKKDGSITKYLVYRYHTYNLIKFGYTKRQIDSIEPHINFINDWGYIDVGKKFRSSFSNRQLADADIVNRIRLQMARIKNSPVWYEMIRQKAKDQGIGEEDALRNDAIFVLRLKLPEDNNWTEEQRVEETIREIRRSPEWLKQIAGKAEAQRIPLDSALRNDAIYMVQQKNSGDIK